MQKRDKDKRFKAAVKRFKAAVLRINHYSHLLKENKSQQLKPILKKILVEIYGINQYHDQYGDCKGKDCPTCKCLNRVEEIIKSGVGKEPGNNKGIKIWNNKDMKRSYEEGRIAKLKEVEKSFNKLIEMFKNVNEYSDAQYWVEQEKKRLFG